MSRTRQGLQGQKWKGVVWERVGCRQEGLHTEKVTPPLFLNPGFVGVQVFVFPLGY